MKIYKKEFKFKAITYGFEYPDVESLTIEELMELGDDLAKFTINAEFHIPDGYNLEELLTYACSSISKSMSVITSKINCQPCCFSTLLDNSLVFSEKGFFIYGPPHSVEPSTFEEILRDITIVAKPDKWVSKELMFVCDPCS